MHTVERILALVFHVLFRVIASTFTTLLSSVSTFLVVLLCLTALGLVLVLWPRIPRTRRHPAAADPGAAASPEKPADRLSSGSG